MRNWRLSETGAWLIYLILVTGCIGVVIAWKMLPQAATVIRVYDLNRELVDEFRAVDHKGLYYKTTGDSLIVFNNDLQTIFPYSRTYKIEIHP